MSKVKKVLIETQQRNIETEVSLIFGLPGQTVQSFKESVQFCFDYCVPTIYAYPLMLLRGTPLYDAKAQLQLIESSDLDLKIDRVQENIPHVIASPTFTYEDWCTMAEIAESLDEYNQRARVQFNRKPTSKMQETLRSTFFGYNKNQKTNVSDINDGYKP